MGLPLHLSAQPVASPPSRPILFVHGIMSDAGTWNQTRVADDVGLTLAATDQSLFPKTARIPIFYDYNDLALIPLHRVKLVADHSTLLFHPELADARFFAISFFDPITASFFKPSVLGISVVNKAAELAHAVEAITALTHIRDVLVVGHSQGGLVTRSYIQGLATSDVCADVAYGCLAAPDPTENRFRGDVAGLLTIDTPHSGAVLARDLEIGGLAIGGTFNGKELDPTSSLLHALNHPRTAISGAVSTEIPAWLQVRSISSFYSDSSCTNLLQSNTFQCDGVVGNAEQRLRPALGLFASGSPNLFDVGHGYVSWLLPIFDCTPWLHSLSCVGNRQETFDEVLDFVRPKTAGQLTSITVTSNSSSPVSYQVSVEQIRGLVSPSAVGTWSLTGTRTFTDQPLGTYRVDYVSGGPAGAGTPVVTPSQTLGSGPGDSWALTFNIDFTVPSTPPSPPVLTSPGLTTYPGPSVSSLSPTFRWQGVSGADGYDLYLEDSSGTTIFHSTTIAAGATSFAYPASLTNGASYNWSMRAHNAFGWSIRSDRRYFSVSTGVTPQDFGLGIAPSLQSVTPGNAASFTVSTTTASGSPQILSFIALNLPAGVTAAFNPTWVISGAATTLTLTTSGSTPAGSCPVTVSVLSDAFVTHTATVALNVVPVVAGNPSVCVTPSNLSFPDQMVGTSSSAQNVTLRNCGNGPLHVTSIGASPEFFIPPGGIQPPFDLAAGGATTLQVGFAPLAAGVRAGNVKIFSDAAGSPAVIALTGTATPAPATTGTVTVQATLNGEPFTGTTLYSLSGPGGTMNFGQVPLTRPDQGAGPYTVAFLAAPPGGGTLTSITPAGTQTLTAGGGVVFSLNFTAPNEFAFSVTPQGGAVAVGNPLAITAQAFYVRGASQNVTVRALGLPPGASVTISPQPIALTHASDSAVVTVTVTSTTPQGLYPLDVLATNADGTSHSSRFALAVVAPQTLSRESVTAAGAQANGASNRQSLSADGRFVAFISSASNLTVDPPAGGPQAYLRDRQTGDVRLMSVTWDGSAPDLGAYGTSISGDGRYVVFSSDSGNILPGAVRGRTAVYVRDTLLGRTALVSQAGDGTPANNYSFWPSISADGRFVAFASSATNLVPGGTNGFVQIFVRDLLTGSTELVSVANDGTQANATTNYPRISADGGTVVFSSFATNLTADPTNGNQVFVRDRMHGRTMMASVALNGPPSSVAAITPPALGASGRFVAFDSAASNLVAGDSNPGGMSRVFVRDMQSGTTRKMRILGTGSDDDSQVSAPAVSADGRFIAARGLTPGISSQLDLWDAQLDRTIVLSVGTDLSLAGYQAGDQSFVPAITGDGSSIAFSSTTTTLVAGDTNGVEDVFVVTNPARAGVFLKSVRLGVGSVIGGGSVQATLLLNAPAPVGAALVSVTSGGAEALPPTTVVIPAGSNSATFPVPTLPVASQVAVTLVASFGGGSPSAVLIINPALASRIAPSGGDHQSAPLRATFRSPLQAIVLDPVNNPVPGIEVHFTVPAAEPTGSFAGNATEVTVTTDARGVATAPALTAGALAGSYVVVASAASVPTPAALVATNADVGFFALPPCRILDTRYPPGGLGGPSLQPRATRVFDVISGNCGVSTAARAISVNVTVTGPTSPGELTLYAGDTATPLANSISFSAGQTRANNGILQLATDGTGTFAVTNRSDGNVHLILDVNGYFK